MKDNELTELIIKHAIEIHRNLGPGLLESVYEVILYHELLNAGLNVKRQESVAIEYNGIYFAKAFSIDILVEERIILEIKALDTLPPAAEAQLLTYLRLKHLHLGLILNFWQPTMRQGIHRVVNGFIEKDPAPDNSEIYLY